MNSIASTTRTAHLPGCRRGHRRGEACGIPRKLRGTDVHLQLIQESDGSRPTLHLDDMVFDLAGWSALLASMSDLRDRAVANAAGVSR